MKNENSNCLFLFMLLCNTCLNAQDFEYFNMKKYTSLTSLHPKEMTNCIMKVSPNPYYDFEDKAGLMGINNNLFKKVFEKANQNDLKILDKVCYPFFI